MEIFKEFVFGFLGLYGFISLAEDLQDIVKKRRQRKSHPSQGRD